MVAKEVKYLWPAPRPWNWFTCSSSDDTHAYFPLGSCPLGPDSTTLILVTPVPSALDENREADFDDVVERARDCVKYGPRDGNLAVYEKHVDEPLFS